MPLKIPTTSRTLPAGAPRADMPIAPASSGAAPMIEIVIGAATVRIPPGIDAVTLSMVLRAVRAAT